MELRDTEKDSLKSLLVKPFQSFDLQEIEELVRAKPDLVTNPPGTLYMKCPILYLRSSSGIEGFLTLERGKYGKAEDNSVHPISEAALFAFGDKQPMAIVASDGLIFFREVLFEPHFGFANEICNPYILEAPQDVWLIRNTEDGRSRLFQSGEFFHRLPVWDEKSEQKLRINLRLVDDFVNSIDIRSIPLESLCAGCQDHHSTHLLQHIVRREATLPLLESLIGYQFPDPLDDKMKERLTHTIRYLSLTHGSHSPIYLKMPEEIMERIRRLPGWVSRYPKEDKTSTGGNPLIGDDPLSSMGNLISSHG